MLKTIFIIIIFMLLMQSHAKHAGKYKSEVCIYIYVFIILFMFILELLSLLIAYSIYILFVVFF